MWYPRAPRNPTLVHTLWKLKAKEYSGLSLPEGQGGAYRRTTDCSVWCFVILCVSSGTQSCLTLCNPMDCRPPGSSVHDVFQARLLEWLAIFFLQGIFLTQGSNPVPCISCNVRRVLCHWVMWLKSHLLLEAFSPLGSPKGRTQRTSLCESQLALRQRIPEGVLN